MAAQWIEITTPEKNGHPPVKRLVNINHIICLSSDGQHPRLYTADEGFWETMESYEEVKQMLCQKEKKQCTESQ